MSTRKEFQKKKATIFNDLTQDYFKLGVLTCTIKAETVHAWAEKSRPLLARIDSLESQIVQQKQTYSADAELAVRETAKIEERTRLKRTAIEDLDTELDDVSAAILQQTEENLDEMEAICGREELLDVILAKYGHDLKITAAKSHSPSFSIPPKLSEISSKLPGGVDVQEWTTDNMHRVLENTHQQLLQFQAASQLVASAPDRPLRPSQQCHSQALVPQSQSSTLQTILSQFKERLTPSKPMQPVHVPTAPRRDDTPPDELEEDDQVEEGYLDDQENSPPPELDVLQSSLEKLEIRLQTTTETSNWQQLLLLRNYHFGAQIDDYLAQIYGSSLSRHTSALEHPRAKIKHIASAITLADEFPSLETRPTHPLAQSYLPTILELLSVDCDDDHRCQMLRTAIQDHIPWILANVGPILNSGRHETIAMMVRCTQTIICQFKPQELGKVALFMLVANLARRLEFPKDHGPWWDLYDAVRSRDYGCISDWNLLELVSFAWFLASGPNVGLRDVLDDDVRSQDITLLAAVLRYAKVYDMIGLLREPAVCSFVRKYEGHIVGQSSGRDYILIMQTSNDSLPCPREEHIWTREGEKVFYTTAGIRLKLGLEIGTRRLVSFIGANRDQAGWFQVEQEDLIQYVQNYHFGELQLAIEKFSSHRA